MISNPAQMTIEQDEVRRYLRRWSEAYRSGIPLALLEEQKEIACARDLKRASYSLLFIREAEADSEEADPYAGVGGALLAAAIEKGLEIPFEEVSLYTVTDQQRCSQNLLDQILREVASALVVILGEEFGTRILQEYLSEPPGPRGTWYEVAGRAILTTISARDAAEDRQAKRILWEDLKKVRARLRGEA